MPVLARHFIGSRYILLQLEARVFKVTLQTKKLIDRKSDDFYAHYRMRGAKLRNHLNNNYYNNNNNVNDYSCHSHI